MRFRPSDLSIVWPPALAVAKRVGTVEIDQGDTSCKTPIALNAIKKTLAHYKAKGKKPTDGSAGTRRRHC